MRISILGGASIVRPRDGENVRTRALAVGLSLAGASVTVFAPDSPWNRRDASSPFHLELRPPTPLRRNPIRLFPEANDAALLLSIVESKPDLAVVSTTMSAPGALLLGANGLPVLGDLPGSEEDLVRTAKGGTDLLVRIKAMERHFVREAEGLLVACNQDRELCVKRHAAHPARIHVAFTPPSIPALAEARTKLGDAVLWLGPAETFANDDALHRLEKEVLPHLKRLRPGGLVRLVGEGCSLLAQRLGVSGVDFVEDLRAEFDRARCLILPSRVARGHLVKAVEALSHGVPIVGYPEALLGCEDLKDSGIVRAGDVEALCTQIATYLDDETAALQSGEAGRQTVACGVPGHTPDQLLNAAKAARRGHVDPGRKLEMLRLLPGSWPKTVEAVPRFLANRKWHLF